MCKYGYLVLNVLNLAEVHFNNNSEDPEIKYDLSEYGQSFGQERKQNTTVSQQLYIDFMHLVLKK